MDTDVAWQPGLFGGEGELAVDHRFRGLRRRWLDREAWLDVVPGWVSGADRLFGVLLSGTAWQHRTIRMYQRVLPEPRLTCRWLPDRDELPDPSLGRMARLLSERYGVQFSQVGANLYRDGGDSVAWHGDRVARELPSSTVALVSLGTPRPFQLRPKGGGRSVRLLPQPGDLIVMGGACQRTWEHSVPKTRGVGARISVQFRHAYPTA
jgi:alkylated DNA repair dioxygenase AlkB